MAAADISWVVRRATIYTIVPNTQKIRTMERGRESLLQRFRFFDVSFMPSSISIPRPGRGSSAAEGEAAVTQLYHLLYFSVNTAQRFRPSGMLSGEARRLLRRVSRKNGKKVKLADFNEKSANFTDRNAGIQTQDLLDLKIRSKIQRALSDAFGAVYSGDGCFLALSTPMLPSAPGVVWGGVWV